MDMRCECRFADTCKPNGADERAKALQRDATTFVEPNEKRFAQKSGIMVWCGVEMDAPKIATDMKVIDLMGATRMGSALLSAGAIGKCYANGVSLSTDLWTAVSGAFVAKVMAMESPPIGTSLVVAVKKPDLAAFQKTVLFKTELPRFASEKLCGDNAKLQTIDVLNYSPAGLSCKAIMNTPPMLGVLKAYTKDGAVCCYQCQKTTSTKDCVAAWTNNGKDAAAMCGTLPRNEESSGTKKRLQSKTKQGGLLSPAGVAALNEQIAECNKHTADVMDPATKKFDAYQKQIEDGKAKLAAATGDEKVKEEVEKLLNEYNKEFLPKYNKAQKDHNICRDKLRRLTAATEA